MGFRFFFFFFLFTVICTYLLSTNKIITAKFGKLLRLPESKYKDTVK